MRAVRGFGDGQAGSNVRYALTYTGDPGPRSIVCKFASRDPQSAASGVFALTYETEVAFYRDLAHTVHISRPHCHFAEIRSGTADVVLVMEDIAPAEQGDQIAGGTLSFPADHGNQAQYPFVVQQNIGGASPAIYPSDVATAVGIALNPRCAK